MSRRTLVWLVSILLLALCVRAAFVLRSAHVPLYGDEQSYDSIASNLSRGLGYTEGTGAEIGPTATRGPAYVLMVAGIYAVAGHHPMAVKVVQALLDCLTALLLFRISWRLFRRADAALLAALLYAVYPPFAMHTRMLLTETLTLFLTTLSIALFVEHGLTRARSALLGGAVAIGIVALSKPVFVLLPLVFGVAAWRTAPRRRSVVMDAVAQCVVIGLVMAPWVARNAVVYHAFIPGVTQGGVTFWGGLGPIEGHVIGGLNDPRVPRGFEAALPRSEVERDRWFYREGLRVIREHPARTLRVVLRKVPRLWFNLMKDEPSVMASHALGTVGVGAGALPGLSLLFAAANLVAMVLAGVGVARARPPAFAADLLLWLVLYFTVVHMAFFAVFRYSLPVYAYLFCFTAAGLTSLARPDAGARGGPRPGASVPAR